MAREEENIPAPAELGAVSGDRVTIQAPEPPDEDGDDGADEAAAAPRPGETAAAAAERARDERGRFAEGRPTRKERRQQHQPNPELQALREQVGRIPDMVRGMEANFKAELARIRESAQPAPAQGGAPADPVAEVNAAMAREMKLMQQDPANFDATTWNKLQERKTELIAEARAEALIKKHLAQLPRQQDDGIPPELRVRQDTILEQFPELSGNLPAQKLFRIERQRLQALGKRDSVGTDLEAAANTVRDMGLRRSMPARGNQAVAVRRQGPPGGNEGGRFGRPQSVEVPRVMLQGLNLPEHLIRRATFGDDAEG